MVSQRGATVGSSTSAGFFGGAWPCRRKGDAQKGAARCDRRELGAGLVLLAGCVTWPWARSGNEQGHVRTDVKGVDVIGKEGRKGISVELVGILAVGAAILGLGWEAYDRLDTRIDALHSDVVAVKSDVSNVKERLAHIEEWIQGRFREGTTE